MWLVTFTGVTDDYWTEKNRNLITDTSQWCVRTDFASVCFVYVHGCACVFHYLADTVNYIFPESCQPLMKARAWLVQCYSWDPEELDLLGRNRIASSLPAPLPPVPPTSSKETTWPRLIHADGHDYFTHLCWFVRIQHYYYMVTMWFWEEIKTYWTFLKGWHYSRYYLYLKLVGWWFTTAKWISFSLNNIPGRVNNTE